jgi:hypothetical protein
MTEYFRHLFFLARTFISGKRQHPFYLFFFFTFCRSRLFPPLHMSAIEAIFFPNLRKETFPRQTTVTELAEQTLFEMCGNKKKL